MTDWRIAVAIIPISVFIVVDCAASDATAGTYMRGPIRQISAYEIQCHDDFYQLAIEETRGEALERTVRLTRLIRESDKISEYVIDKAEQFFEEFRYISSISFSCGLGDKFENSKELKPRRFLSVFVEGGHKEPFKEAQDECLAKGWNFEFDTKRSLLIEGDTVEIKGDEIGYCYGETEYFTVPLSADSRDEL